MVLACFFVCAIVENATAFWTWLLSTFISCKISRKSAERGKNAKFHSAIWWSQHSPRSFDIIFEWFDSSISIALDAGRVVYVIKKCLQFIIQTCMRIAIKSETVMIINFLFCAAMFCSPANGVRVDENRNQSGRIALWAAVGGSGSFGWMSLWNDIWLKVQAIVSGGCRKRFSETCTFQ